MKKLMIAAAAAAMVGGAFADKAELPAPKFNLATNTALQASQVLQFKTKASSWKTLNLNKGAKEFGKTLKNPVYAIDGVYYYAGTNTGWMVSWWSKEEFGCKKVAAPKFDVFQDADAKKALAVFGGPWGDMSDPTFEMKGWNEKEDGSAEATEAYASLKFAKNKTTKQKELDLTIKSIKDLTGSLKYSVKTYKEGKKTAQEQVDAYVKKLIEKAKKVNKDVK